MTFPRTFSHIVGVELFEFKNAQKPENNFECWKTGVFPFCVQDPDAEGLAKKIVASGSKQRMPVREYYPGEKPYRRSAVKTRLETSLRSLFRANRNALIEGIK